VAEPNADDVIRILREARSMGVRDLALPDYFGPGRGITVTFEPAASASLARALAEPSQDEFERMAQLDREQMEREDREAAAEAAAGQSP
jgi:hypothetical protein